MKEHISLISEPVFLVGAERSGTTLLRLMLDHHPQIAFHSEFEYVVDYFQENNWPQLDRYYECLEIDRLFQSSNFSIDFSLNYPQLVNSFLVQKRDQTGKALVGATVHRHFDRLLQIWPDARFIHIVRDGRDVARSCMGMNWSGNVWTGIDRWIETEKLWSQLKKTISSEQYTEVSYETLIAEPVETLAHLCNFIGTSYDPAMLSYPQTTTYNLPDVKLLWQWKCKLSEQEIQLVETKIGDMLVERGYKLSGLPLLTINSVMKPMLRLHSKWSVVQGRIRIYGLWLIVSSFLSRHLQLKQWNKHVQLKCNNIDTARLK